MMLRELGERHHPAVLLVTHDVEEAIVLADRVLVLVDGRLAIDRPLALSRPRLRTDPAFAHHRELLLAALGVGSVSASAT